MRQLPESAEAELFAHRFTSIASEMGDVLRRTALSTNVKERLDFSCGILDDEGYLVVNAPHIPVHLGALGLCVRGVQARFDQLGDSIVPGDVIVTNHPAYGGSHLPDVTLLTPVFIEQRLIAWVASRAHHSEIGGQTPGSMPAHGRTLAEEGVVLAPFRLMAAGEPRWQELAELLAAPPWPSRSIDENLADLRAAQAAGHRGAESLRALASRYGTDSVQHFMKRLRKDAAARMKETLQTLGKRSYEASEELDDGHRIVVRIEIEDGASVVDFEGTSHQHPGNLNAPEAVVRSAVLYVLRLLVGKQLAREEIPLNEGFFDCVEVRIPRGSMLSPVFSEAAEKSPAVVGGNVETSQRVVGTLLKALGLVAGSQGTMNNTIFGDDSFGYYETVCGGSGAGPTFDGESGVHCHMTNTRITDPEILEHRYPVRLERFEIRPGSGGQGRHRGGDGVIRELLFERPVTLSLLTQHRTSGPFGLAGGEAGAAGRQRVLRAGGDQEELGSSSSVEIEAGDRLILETPGGGGYGTPLDKTVQSD